MLQRCFLLVLILPIGAGCGGNPNLAPVTGKLTLDGNPLQGAEVVFTPTSAVGGSSIATTDQSGGYELYYSPGVKGAWIGEHKITISKADETPEGVRENLPPQYNTKSQLKVEVASGGSEFNFKLEMGKWKPKKPKKYQ